VVKNSGRRARRLFYSVGNGLKPFLTTIKCCRNTPNKNPANPKIL
jgi:hypothetical protein